MVETIGQLIGASEVADLQRSFAGTLLTPGDAGYDEARRLWNAMIDRHPALIARCTTTADVHRALAFARARSIDVSIRGGGHNVGGSAVVDGGVMIDLSPMKGIALDAATRVVRVQPGVLLGELDAATQASALAVPAGIVTTTGVAGLTLGGGIGWLMRRHGLTCDRLRAATVVTADGAVVRASETDQPDLLWGLRGGGGNFGIVTEFEYEAVPLGPEVIAGAVIYPFEDAAEVLRRYGGWAADAPDNVTTIVTLRTVLPVAPFPPELHGQRVVSVGVLHAGALEDGEREIAPLRQLGRPLLDLVTHKPFLAQQRMFDGSVPWDLRYYWKSEFLPELTDAAIANLVEHAAVAPQPWSYSIIFQLGGSISRLAPASSAYEDRSAAFAVNINGVAERPDEDAEVIAWTREHWEGLRRHTAGRVYVNFLGDEGQDRVRAAYGPQKYDRLVEVKDRYDPENVFHLNQNIRPSRFA